MENQPTYKRANEQKKWGSGGLGKIPPQAIDLEEVVLGAILCENGAFSRSSVLINAETFYKQAHANIYNSCKDLYDKSQPIDLMTVKHDLELKGELEKCGGMMYLAELTQKVNSSANLETHCFILKEKFAKRQLIEMASNIQRLAYEDTEDIFETIDFLPVSRSR
jgi:replicative DNA helicase